MQRAALTPVVAADPSRDALLALALEPDDEGEVRPVDRRRDDLELRDLGDVPHPVLRVAVGDASGCARAGHGARCRRGGRSGDDCN